MEVYVERLNANEAVCVCETGETCVLSREQMPEGIFEGCVLREENGAFLLDPVRTEARKAELLVLQNSLFVDDTPADPV